MSAKEVKVYSTSGCPWCKRVKKFLDDNSIEYQDFNIAEDSKAREEMINKCKSLAVPTICINGEVIVGFNEALLKEKLGL